MPLVRPLSTGVALALWLLFTDSFIPSAISPRSTPEKTSVFQEDDQWATTSLFAVSYTHLTLPTTPYV